MTTTRSRRAAGAILALGVLGACGAGDERAGPPSPEDSQSLPLVLEAGVQGRFSLGRSWSMHVEPDGRAALFLRHGIDARSSLHVLEPEVRVLELAFEDLDAVRGELIEQRFFELPAVLGRGVDDGDTSWIDVRLGNRWKRVEMLFIHPSEIAAGTNGVSGTSDEVARAQRVFGALARHVPDDALAARTPAWERALQSQRR